MLGGTDTFRPVSPVLFVRGTGGLNRLTGLEDRIAVHKGSALDLPFPDDTFDVVWMQNVGMNIADKRKLYSEICRVLKPGGRFAFQEMAAGKAATTYFPLPWASDPADNFLVSVEEMGSLLGESGFATELLEDTSDAHLSAAAATANATPAAPGPRGAQPASTDTTAPTTAAPPPFWLSGRCSDSVRG